MRDKKVSNIYNILAIIAGLWVLTTGWIWVYFANLFISLPFLIAGIILWNKGKEPEGRSLLNKAAGAIIAISVIVSLTALIVVK